MRIGRSIACSAVVLTLVVALGTGCSIQRKAMSTLSQALANEQSLLFSGENDPVLASQSLPTVLKVYEALIEKDSANAQLLTATGKAFTLYAFAFVQSPADRLPPEQAEFQKAEHKRARLLYQRARDYAFDALECAHPGLRATILEKPADSALAVVSAADTTALYWAGVAWMGQLTSGKPSLSALLHLPKAAALVRAVNTYAPSFDSGSAHEALISYYGLAPSSMGGDTARARQHFDSAVALSGGSRARPYVAYAQSVALKRGDREMFTSLLSSALEIDTKSRSRNRLVNLVLQDSARWLLASADLLFAPLPSPQ